MQGATLERTLAASFLRLRHDVSLVVGSAEVNHQAAAEKLGLEDPLCATLAEVYMEGLDGKGDVAAHTRIVTQAKRRLGQRPKWMHRHRGGDPALYTEESESILAKLHSCDLGKQLRLRGERLVLDAHLLLEPHAWAVGREQRQGGRAPPDDAEATAAGEQRLGALERRWKKQHAKYCKEFQVLKKRLEREGGAQKDEGRGADAYFALVRTFREELLRPYTELRGRLTSEPPELLAEASAIYKVVYERAQHAAQHAAEHATRDEDQQPEYYVAFAWHVAGDFLLHTKKARLGRERQPERALFIGL